MTADAAGFQPDGGRMTLNLQPISLLRGTHRDTATTGRGCFMNVVAYLNGDLQITDSSECVCRVVRHIAIYVNDECSHKERKQLLPLILRAIGSRTDDADVIAQRARLCADYAAWQSDQAAAYSMYRPHSAAEAAARAECSATYAEKMATHAVAPATHVAAAAATYAASAAEAAERAARANAASAYHRESVQRGIALLDAMLRLTDEPAITPAHVERAQRLATTA
jgi:hypothetical protein